jgi:hypothetical protein
VGDPCNMGDLRPNMVSLSLSLSGGLGNARSLSVEVASISF